VFVNVRRERTVEASEMPWRGEHLPPRESDRWATLLTASGLTVEQVEDVLSSDAYGALSAELRHAEANHHDLDALLPRLVAARSLDDADDIASVLHTRVARATARPAGSGRTRKRPMLIVGLIPHAGGQMTDDVRQALDERRELIEARAGPCSVAP